MAEPEKLVELEMKLFASIEGVHEKLDESMRMQRDHQVAVRKYADDMAAVKLRQNRHGEKLREERRKREALEVFVGYPTGGPILPPRPAMRAPSRPEWDPEDTNPHVISPDDVARVRDLSERQKRESQFWREFRWKLVFQALGAVAVIALTAYVTHLAHLAH